MRVIREPVGCSDASTCANSWNSTHKRGMMVCRPGEGIAAVEFDANPFVVLSYVTGPALLTNATSLILLSTTNRFARAIDRSRYLTERLISHDANPLHEVEASELRVVGRRIRLIGRAISGFYLAAAMFALATVTSILGAVLATMISNLGLDVIIALAVLFGLIGFAAFVVGALALVVETRLTMGALAFESDAAVAAMEKALATRR